MTLSVSCPSCGKTFRNIKLEMAGKKARCSCGTVVRLGSRESKQPDSKRKPRDQKPEDLLDVDLLGDEMLGDQLLGGDLYEPDPSPPISHQTEPIKQIPSQVKPAASRSKRDKSARSESKPARLMAGPTANVQPEIALDPPGREANPNSKPKRANRTRSAKSKSRGTPPPEVPLTVSVSPSASKRNSRRPLFEQTYGDLDDILSGAGDAAPLIARPRPFDPSESDLSSRNGRASAERPSTDRETSTPGFLAALGSATLAFWFGLFVAGSRFETVDWFLLSGFSTHLSSVFTATFGASEVPTMFQIMFVVLGWLLWGVAVAMVLIAVGQFVNAFVKLLTNRQPVSWSDGFAGALGVSAVFLLVAIVFCQTSFARHEHQALNVYEPPFADEGERLENVTLLRAAIDKRNRSFTTSMLVGATVPMSIFALSMLRLFTKSSDEP